MSGSADDLPSSTVSRDDNDPPYLGTDLQARRTALGLQREDLAPLLNVDVERYWDRESGDRSAGRYSAKALIAMETFVAEQSAVLIDTALPDDNARIVLGAVVDQDEFDGAFPRARVRHTGASYPFTLQHVAAGRAAAELGRRGFAVEVFRADRRADLVVRRLAVGLLKAMAGNLFGVEKKHYAAAERGVKPPPAGLLAELQAIDDFISLTAGQLDVIEAAGVSTVLMLGGQEQFERHYPLARTLRDGVAYPARVHEVAAARRAQALEASGRPSRIAVIPR